MSALALSNIINVSVTQSNPGVGSYNTSNLAICSDDAPLASSETITFSAVAASGAFKLSFAGNLTASINYNDPLYTIQAKINAVSGQSNIIVSGSIASQSLTLSQPGIYGAIPLAVVSSNTLETSGSVAITVTPLVVSSGWSGGSLGYASYVAPTQVALDWGTGSKTTAMANAIFSQQPNILNGGGQLVIIPMVATIQNFALSGVAASGAFVLTYNGNNSSSISYSSTPAQIQAIVQAMPGLSQATVTGSLLSESFNITLNGVYGAGLAFTVTTNTLETAGSSAITFTITTPTTGETIGAAVTRTVGLVQYFGILVNESVGTSQVVPSADVEAAATVVQALNKMIFFVTNSTTDLTATTGLVAVISSSSDTQCRMLYYGDTSSSGIANAINMSAAYAGRALSVNFNGSNTTLTMQFQVLTGINVDPSMTQTIYNEALAAGADIYVSFQGDGGVACSSANQFFDNVYNQQWLAGAIQVAYFNYLAQSGTKVPQTEFGMNGVKNAIKQVLNQAVTNGMLAPGTWNSATTFGNPANLILNVAQIGYYIYSVPIAQQLQTARAARQAPLISIAAKLAGAIQSGTCVITLSA